MTDFIPTKFSREVVSDTFLMSQGYSPVTNDYFTTTEEIISQTTDYDPEVIAEGFLSGEELTDETLVTETSEVIYKDFNQKNIGQDTFIYNMEAIIQSVMNTIFTVPTQRVFRPAVGASLDFAIFAPINEITSSRLRQILIDSVEKWEPRIIVDRNKSYINPNDIDEGYDIFLVYQVRGMGTEKYILSMFYTIYGSI